MGVLFVGLLSGLARIAGFAVMVEYLVELMPALAYGYWMVRNLVYASAGFKVIAERESHLFQFRPFPPGRAVVEPAIINLSPERLLWGLPGAAWAGFVYRRH
jgi:hypothetical protein